MLYPLTFQPIFQERIWGGRKLETLFGKQMPPGNIGEAWEISDRPEANSVITNGPLKGKTLADVMTADREGLMGRARAQDGRFPLLVKLLDAQDNLSLQVHPPQHLAADLGGAPKTEMWYVADAEKGAMLYAGLKKGVTKDEFASKIHGREIAECFHQLPVNKGDSLFLPSGRVHALGKGLVIFEIQQNSDTTYRVYDWSRVDAAGKPRQLHIDESLKCIDFQDFEPSLTNGSSTAHGDGVRSRALARHALFAVDLIEMEAGRKHQESIREPRVVGVVSGAIEIAHPEHPVKLNAGQFALVPASMGDLTLKSGTDARVLVAAPG